MKKLIFIIAGLSILTVISCRQEDENFSSEDAQSLRVLQSRTKVTSDTISYGAFNQSKEEDGDPAPPPIK